MSIDRMDSATAPSGCPYFGGGNREESRRLSNPNLRESMKSVRSISDPVRPNIPLERETGQLYIRRPISSSSLASSSGHSLSNGRLNSPHLRRAAYLTPLEPIDSVSASKSPHQEAAASVRWLKWYAFGSTAVCACLISYEIYRILK